MRQHVHVTGCVSQLRRIGFVLCSDYHVVERRAEVRQIAISRELNCTDRLEGTAAGITSSSPPAPLAAPLAT